MERWNRRTVHLAAVALCAAALAVPRGAEAQRRGRILEPWFVTVEAGAAGPLNDPMTNQFRPGFSGAVGFFYMPLPMLALGGRVRAGFLTAGDVIPQDPVDRGALDMGLINAVMRIRPLASVLERDRRAAGLWLDVGPGVGLTDGRVVFAYETGVGYGFPAGPISIGPVFRFSHFVETEGRFADSQVLTWTGGVEVTFPDELHLRPEPEEVAEVERPALAINHDRDGDGFLDTADGCPDQPEVYNGFEDEDGCPDEGRGEFVNDALVVNERVFFDYDRAELRPEGMAQLDAVVEHWRENGEHYLRLEVYGHADARGSEAYNTELSVRRATAVREYLTAHGVPESMLHLYGYGESEPAIPDADTEYEHQVNRRVEFHVVWQEGERPEGAVPAAHPTMPDHVDEAPASHRNR